MCYNWCALFRKALLQDYFLSALSLAPFCVPQVFLSIFGTLMCAQNTSFSSIIRHPSVCHTRENRSASTLNELYFSVLVFLAARPLFYLPRSPGQIFNCYTYVIYLLASITFSAICLLNARGAPGRFFNSDSQYLCLCASRIFNHYTYVVHLLVLLPFSAICFLIARGAHGWFFVT